MDDFDQILENGIVFKGASKGGPKDDGKVKTKAKKKKYITGAHGSGSARQKAKYREQRANRKSQHSQWVYRLRCLFTPYGSRLSKWYFPNRGIGWLISGLSSGELG